MVRNSKRKAFTIVELVIVIAVIAILAAVMIPTFGGVIDSANLSADKQLLSTVNTQLSIYTGLGNKIETEADLWKALKGDFNGGSDLTAKFDPKSANKGYHYWYNIAKEQVELLKYDETDGLMNVNTGKMMLRADSVARAITGNGFASSPRCFGGSGESQYKFYFLDTGSNAFAEFFKYIENLSTTDTSDYADKHNAATTLGGDNAALAAQLKDKMAKTAILTDKPAVVGGNTIEHVYIPENKTDNTEGYYLNHEGTTGITANVQATIVIPDNIKLGDGCLDAFGGVTVKVDVEIENIADVISAGAVSVNATVQIGDNEYTINGNVVINKNTNEEADVKLQYKNPVEVDKIVVNASDDSNIVMIGDNYYVALDTIENGNYTLKLAPNKFVYTVDGKTKETYNQDYTWTSLTDGVTIDPTTGVITVAGEISGNTISFKLAPVAVNNGETKTVNVTIVEVDSVGFDFETNLGKTQIKQTLGGTVDVSIKYSGDKTTAKITGIEFGYAIRGTANTIEFNADQKAKLGLPVVEMTVGADAYFTIDNNGIITFTDANVSKIQTIVGKEIQNVTVTIKNNDKFNGAIVPVGVEPCPFDVGHPIYADKSYNYTIGNDNVITLDKIFDLGTAFAGLNLNGKVTVELYDIESIDGNGFYHTKLDASTYKVVYDQTDWTKSTINFKDITGKVAVQIGMNTNLFPVVVNVVDGKNIEAKEDFVTPATGTSLVLHNDIIFTDIIENCTLKLNNGHIYGNYFTVQAHKFYDSDRNTSNGYALISMENKSSLNQLIIDGPVYHTAALSASNTNLLIAQTNPGGFFANGVITSGTPVINDSYISGFNSPVRINSGTFEANNTVFEGGAWSNVFIAAATKVTLKDCKTIQSRVNGYEPTFAKMEKVNEGSFLRPNYVEKDTATPVIGMGIYIHGETMKNAKITNLELDLTGTEQYNWLSNTSHDKNFGFYVKTAIEKAFNNADNASVIAKYNHSGYVNAAIASLDVDVVGMLTIPAFKDVTIPEGSSVYPYIPNQGSGSDSSLKLDVWVMSYAHADSGCNCSVDEHGVNFTYGVDAFRAERFESPVEIHDDCQCRACTK